MEVWVYLMAITWLIKYARARVALSEPFRCARIAHLFFLSWLGFGLLQMIPLPVAIVEVISPNTVLMYQQARQVAQQNQQDLPPNPAFRPLPSFPDKYKAANKKSNNVGQLISEAEKGSHALIETGLKDKKYTAGIRLTLDLFASINTWLKSLAYVLLFALTLLLVNSRQRLRMLLYSLVFSGLLQAIYGSLSLALEGGGVTKGTFINRNHYAAYLVLCLSVGIGLLIAAMGRSRALTSSWRGKVQYAGQLLLSIRAPLRIFLAIMVIALVMTHSRMGNTSFFVAMLIAGGLFLGLSKELPRSVFLLIISLIVVDVLIIGSWVGLDKVRDRIFETSLATDRRDEVSIHSLQMWQDYPLFGVGAGSWYSVFPGYRKGDASPGFYEHTHNDYLEFLTEYGLVGIFLLASIVLLALVNAMLALKKRQSQLAKGAAFSALMAIFAMLIHATVEFNLQMPAYAATFMVLLAIPWISRYNRFVRGGEH